MGKFSSEAIRLAKQSEKKYGVPASVTLAQYALESGYGKSQLAKTKNNYFGMRNGSKGWQSYDSMAESFYAHGELLSKPLYANKTANAKTVEEYVNAIAETYAPSSDGNNDYAGKLMQIINENNLTQYDSGKYDGSASIASDSGGIKGTVSDIGNSILSVVIKAGAVLLEETEYSSDGIIRSDESVQISLNRDADPETVKRILKESANV